MCLTHMDDTLHFMTKLNHDDIINAVSVTTWSDNHVHFSIRSNGNYFVR